MIAHITLCKGFLRKNKRLWVPILALLTLITAVTISVSEMPNAYIRSQEDAARNIYGEHDAIVYGIERGNQFIKGISYGTLSGCLSFNETVVYQLPLIGSMDDETMQSLRIRVAEGRLPSNDNEIAIERWALLFLPEGVKIGDEITLNYEELFTERECSKKVVISGILENYSIFRVPSDSVEPDFPYNGLPSIICNYGAFSDNEIQVHFSMLKLNNIENEQDYSTGEFSADSAYDNTCEAISAMYGDGFLAKSVNSSLYKFIENIESDDNGDGRILKYLAGIMVTVTCLIVIVFELLLLPKLRRSSIILYNIGATAGVRFGHVVYVLTIVAETGVIMGYCLSFILAYSLSSAISRIFQIQFRFWFSPVRAFEALGIISLVTICGALLIGWIFVELLKDSPKVKFIPRGIPDMSDKPVHLLFLRHLSQHPGSFVISAFAMSVGLFCFSLSIAAIFTQDWGAHNEYVPDISIYREFTMSATELHLPAGDNSAVSEDALSFLQTFPGADTYFKSIFTQKNVTANLYYPTNTNNATIPEGIVEQLNSDLERFFGSAKCIPFISETDYNDTLLKYGYDVSDSLYTVDLTEIEPISRKLIKDNKIKVYGEIDASALSDGTQILLCVSSRALRETNEKSFESLPGTKVILSRITDLEYRHDYEFTIGAVLIVPESTDIFSYSMNQFGYYFFSVFSGCFDSIGINSDYTHVQIELTDPEKETDIVPFLNIFSNKAPNMTIKSNGQLNAELRRMRLATLLITILIALPIIVASIAAIWIIHVHGLRSQCHEWRILYRIGLSERDFQMLFIMDFVAEIPLAYAFFMIFLWVQGATLIPSGLLVFLLSATALIFLMFVPICFYHKRFLGNFIYCKNERLAY